MEYHQPRRVLPFRWIFPVGQLLLCFLLVSITMLPFGVVSWSLRARVFEFIRSLNLPGGLVQLPIMIFRADKMEWSPPNVDSQLWRAMTWPVLGMLFWWIAGRAAEALTAIKYRQVTPKIGWTETVVGFLLTVVGATFFVGFLVFSFYESDRAGMIRLAAAGGLWALLGSLSVVARFRQWRLRKIQSRASG
ncbi:MAG TPA: hypothetical protein VFR84_08495 [Candidatus Angelobacter sp.]|nr:hypothetical protein [Candidatus Angelobacter sp.]